MKNNLALAGAVLSAALCALLAALLITAFAALPALPEQDFGGVLQAIAGTFAVALAMVVLLAILFILSLIALAFGALSFILFLRARKKGAGRRSAVLLLLSCIGTAAALLAGSCVCGISPALTALGALCIALAATECALRVLCAVRLLKRAAPDTSDTPERTEMTDTSAEE